MAMYTAAELMAELVKRANAGTLDIQTDNEGQYVIYTNIFEQFDGTAGDEPDPKFADALENPEDYCVECDAEFPASAKSLFGDWHNEDCSLHPANQTCEALEGVDDPAVKAADTLSRKALLDSADEAIELGDSSDEDS